MADELCPDCGHKYKRKDVKFRQLLIATSPKGFERACDILSAAGYTITFACDDAYGETSEEGQ